MDEPCYSPQNGRNYTHEDLSNRDDRASYDYDHDISDVSQEAPELEQRQGGGGAGVGAGAPGFRRGEVEGKGKAGPRARQSLLNIFQCTTM